MSPAETELEVLERPLTKEELDAIAFIEAATFAGALATKEAEMTEDNYGGVYLHKDIAFGD